LKCSLRSVVAIEALISESTLNAALSGGALRNDMPMKKYLATTLLGQPDGDLCRSEPNFWEFTAAILSRFGWSVVP